MRIFVTLIAALAFGLTLPACTTTAGHSGKVPPGQVQKATGYNPASGKFKGAPAAPSKGKSKGKGKY